MVEWEAVQARQRAQIAKLAETQRQSKFALIEPLSV